MHRLILVFLIFFSNSIYAEGSKIKNEFRIFEALIYSGKPDMSVYGIENMPLINHTDLWSNQLLGDNIPNDQEISSLVSGALKEKKLAVIDIEHWPLGKCSASSVRSSIYKYVHTLDRIKKSSNNIELGLYSILPSRDYWSSIAEKNSFKYLEWQKTNDQLYNIERQVDMFFPSLYTFYHDKVGWVKYATTTIEEARRLNPLKPVYVFIWPQYHDSNKSIGLDYIDNDFWLLQLETVKKYADGVVIWGGWDFENSTKMSWDPSAEWWTVTKRFAENLK